MQNTLTKENPVTGTARSEEGIRASEWPPNRPRSQPRLVFIDNVRWVMILLVLGMHAAVTYSPLGDWYYREHPAMDPVSILFFATYQGVLQGFFMALLFFIAGCFAARSYDAKGAGRFMAGRLYRLGLPTLFFVVLLGPLTEYFVAHSWRTNQSFAHEMGIYFLRGRFLSGTGPMWFCAALLIFSAIYALIEASGVSAALSRRRNRQISRLRRRADDCSHGHLDVSDPGHSTDGHIGIQHAAVLLPVVYHHVQSRRRGRTGGLD